MVTYNQILLGSLALTVQLVSATSPDATVDAAVDAEAAKATACKVAKALTDKTLSKTAMDKLKCGEMNRGWAIFVAILIALLLMAAIIYCCMNHHKKSIVNNDDAYKPLNNVTPQPLRNGDKIPRQVIKTVPYGGYD